MSTFWGSLGLDRSRLIDHHAADLEGFGNGLLGLTGLEKFDLNNG